jgi:hypothetical protein
MHAQIAYPYSLHDINDYATPHYPTLLELQKFLHPLIVAPLLLTPLFRGIPPSPLKEPSKEHNA